MPRTTADSGESLADLLEQLPEDLARQAFTHASWVEHRAESYERLAFLGDVVLSLAVSTHLYPRFERYGAGRLTKVRAQAVSGASCAEVALELGVPSAWSRPRRSARVAASQMLAEQRARAGIRLRGDHRRRLHRLRHRARRAGGGQALRGPDRRGAGEPRGLQVAAPGAPRPAGRGGQLPDRRRGGPGARSPLRRRSPRWTAASSAAARAGPRRAPSRRPPCGRSRRRRR